MVSHSPLPYEVQKTDELNYVFVTKHGILKKTNPNKQQLMKAFGDLLAQDCYDIVF